MELLLDWTQHRPRLLPEHLLEVCCHVVPHAWPHNSIVRIVSQVHNLFLPGGPTLPWWMQWLGVFMYWSRTKLLCLWSGICKLIPRNCFITGLGLLQKLFHKPSQITIIILWSCFHASGHLGNYDGSSVHLICTLAPLSKMCCTLGPMSKKCCALDSVCSLDRMSMTCVSLNIFWRGGGGGGVLRFTWMSNSWNFCIKLFRCINVIAEKSTLVNFSAWFCSFIAENCVSNSWFEKPHEPILAKLKYLRIQNCVYDSITMFSFFHLLFLFLLLCTTGKVSQRFFCWRFNWGAGGAQW